MSNSHNTEHIKIIVSLIENLNLKFRLTLQSFLRFESSR